MQKMHLPEPDSHAKQHSAELQQKIIAAIRHSHEQHIDFAHFMQMALYEPALGYYSAGLQKFGAAGDFITAPETSPLFAQTLANPIADILADMPQANILEFGAGSGILAAELLLALESLNQLPEYYFIVELSASLQQRQQQLIAVKAPHLFKRVRWLNQLPTKKINAVVIANEVLDAMPVQRFIMQDHSIKTQVVTQNNNILQFESATASEKLIHAINQIEGDLNRKFESPYNSEINLYIQPWLQSLSDCLNQSAVFIIDYGYHRHEYYSPERHMGTLMCYIQHRSHDNALFYPGLQDITAFVDFTAVAEAALNSGFDVDGYTSQANFLLASGLPQLVEKNMSDDLQQQIQLSQQVKTLTLPSEMGERFKVMALSKNLQKSISGFELRDFRDRL